MRSSNIHGFVRVAWCGLVLTLMAVTNQPLSATQKYTNHE